MKILVIEDDELTAAALVATLTNQNYTVETASDGETGWELTEAFTYDLILLDLTLPKLDGISLCKRLRSQGHQMPILLLTARNSSHDKALGLDAGADDYVVKPFDPEELAARIRALLRRNQATSQSVLEWGDLHFDPRNCEVTYRTKALSLTAKEYALLELFLRNSRRVLSCGAILENLWAFEEIPSNEAVRTHIKGLRQKLKAGGAPTDLIETVYGIGYRLKPKERGDGGVKRDERDRGRGEVDDSIQNSLSSVSAPAQQQTLAMVSKVWDRFKERVSEQIEVLELTVKALSHQELDRELQQLAKQEAHSLAGALGTFGLSQGSQLARQIEHSLEIEQLLSQNEAVQLGEWVRLLRGEIERSHSLSQEKSASTTQDATPSFTEAIPEIEHPSLQIVQRDRTLADPAQARVMVVDDDPQMLEIVRSLLEPWGLKVTTLANPQQFWPILEATSPDLLILDIQMPEINGIDLCQIVRNDSHWGDLPILFLTAHTDSDTINQVFSVGADDFVSKPIVGPELVTRIINRLERIRSLQRAIADRQQAKEALIGSQQQLQLALEAAQIEKNNLELRVAARTTELLQVNKRLESELEERKRIQEDLQISQTRFAGILDIAEDAIISLDRHQRITLFNQGAEKIFGYLAEEVIGQSLDILLPLRFVPLHQQYVAEFGQSAISSRRMGERREIFGRRKNGSEFPAEASISKLNLDKEVAFTVFLQDITDRKQIERMKDEFVSVVSHELRTPLTSIHGSLGMLASGLLKADSEECKRMLHIAVDSTDRLVRLINDILDIERIESGRVKMEKEDCNIDDLIAEAVNVVQALADRVGVTLSVSNQSISVWADPDRIVQTLINLLSNAIKFSAAGNTVLLTVQKQNNDILFMVKDRGRGIPTDKLEGIFERFQQVDSSDSRNHEGTGLGLAICRSIVQQHNGKIWVESVLGEGSTFYFMIPMVKES